MTKLKPNNMNDDDNNHVSKPFLPILEDAVLFAKYALLTKDVEISRLLTRSSILHCTLTVEALANNMIQFMNLNGRFSESIDKLDIIAKFDFYSLLKNQELIDRGTYCIQVFQDLIDIRNKYVHPKILKRELNIENSKLTPIFKKNFSQLDIIPFRDHWDIKDAKSCLTALLRSLDQFLLKVIGFEKEEMSLMFIDFMSVNGLSGHFIPTYSEWVEWAESELKYRPKFYCDHILLHYK